MESSEHFALEMLIVGVVGLVTVMSNRMMERSKVPVPLVVLVVSAVVAQLVPQVTAPPPRTVEHILTAALVFILFDGGLHIGWSRFRQAVQPILMLGVLGTFLTVAGAAALLHLGFGLEWYVALLVATAIAPTDPAMVFSVLGQREISGRAGTVLEGESGANDPVGIALMASLIAAGELSGQAFGQVGVTFVSQMLVGAAVGLLSGRLLLWFMRRVSLPGEGLYPLRTLASVVVIYAVATVAHGSGFLAVFVVGIWLGEARAPYKREIERFHSAVASLAEIVAFVVLGLTIHLGDLLRADVLVPGVVLALVLMAVVRPVLVGLCLMPSRMQRNEAEFVLFAGLKGAVPLLLGELLLAADVPGARRLYGIIVVVVILSVLVQGTATPLVARLLALPMRPVEPEPWALGVRLKDEPQGVHSFVVAAGAPVEGKHVADVQGLQEDTWISVVVRDGTLVTVRGDTTLQAGDQVLVLSEGAPGDLRSSFEG